jgi:DnaK suppressor protein
VEHLSRAQLAQLQAAINAEIQQLEQRLRAQDDARELVEDPLDHHEQASLETDRRRSLRLNQQDAQRLDELYAARARFESRTYGICEESDEPISFRRLCENPATRYTAEAQAEIEKAAARERALFFRDDGQVY